MIPGNVLAQTEIGMIAALRAASAGGVLPYAWRTLDSYPDDFDAYLKEKANLRMPAAWAVFLGLSDGLDRQDDDSGWSAEARYALVVAGQNLRGETATRHGFEGGAEPGSYQLTIDAIRVLDGQDLGFLVAPLRAGGARLVARTAEMRTQGMSLMAIEFSCRIPIGQFEELGNPADWLQLHADWDVPPHGNVEPPLPAAQPDAEDMLEIPQ